MFQPIRAPLNRFVQQIPSATQLDMYRAQAFLGLVLDHWGVVPNSALRTAMEDEFSEWMGNCGLPETPAENTAMAPDEAQMAETIDGLRTLLEVAHDVLAAVEQLIDGGAVVPNTPLVGTEGSIERYHKIAGVLYRVRKARRNLESAIQGADPDRPA